jgi:RES domain-containing protein
LEVLVHLSSQAQIPEYVCIKARIPESIVLDLRDFGLLPPDWVAVEPTVTAMIGTRWLMEKASAVLRVPSVVIPRESNYVLNPEHPEFRQIIIDDPLLFEFDVRLFSAGNAARQ